MFGGKNNQQDPFQQVSQAMFGGGDSPFFNGGGMGMDMKPQVKTISFGDKVKNIFKTKSQKYDDAARDAKYMVNGELYNSPNIEAERERNNQEISNYLSDDKEYKIWWSSDFDYVCWT